MVGAGFDGARRGLAVLRDTGRRAHARAAVDRLHDAGADLVVASHRVRLDSGLAQGSRARLPRPRELFSSTNWAHPLHWQDRSGVKRSGHRPDLVAFAVSGNPVAIEVELAAKSRSRLAAILRVHRTWSYSNNSRGVVYICGDEAAHSRIERAGKRAGLYVGGGFLRIELLDTIKEQARAEFERARAASEATAA